MFWFKKNQKTLKSPCRYVYSFHCIGFFKTQFTSPRASKCFDEIPDTFTFTDYIDCISEYGSRELH